MSYKKVHSRLSTFADEQSHKDRRVSEHNDEEENPKNRELFSLKRIFKFIVMKIIFKLNSLHK
jgi:hypothetical protein